MSSWRAEKTVHFRYVRTSSEGSHEFLWKDQAHRLLFESKEFSAGEGLVLSRPASNSFAPLDSQLLLALSIYFGEDAVAPGQRRDAAHVWTRGTLQFERKQFNRFIELFARRPPSSLPLWRRRLMDRAVIYYSHATRLGVYSMPVTIGLFALSLECLGNYEHGRRDRHFTFGEKRFLSHFRKSLEKGKRNPRTRDQTRRFEKFVIQDVELLHGLRNAFYGHSLLHLHKDRVRIAEAMRRWYEREGFSVSFARRSFPVARLENALTSEFWPLYKVGLRTCRLFLGIALKYPQVPFASHDFAILGDLPMSNRSA